MCHCDLEGAWKRFFIVESFKKQHPWLTQPGMDVLMDTILPADDMISDSKRSWEAKAKCARVILKIVHDFL